MGFWSRILGLGFDLSPGFTTPGGMYVLGTREDRKPCTNKPKGSGVRGSGFRSLGFRVWGFGVWGWHYAFSLALAKAHQNPQRNLLKAKAQ